MKKKQKLIQYDDLDPHRLISTISTLSHRIAERFPDANLAGVCIKLLAIAEQTNKRIKAIQKPHLLIRFITIFMMLSLIVMIGLSIQVLQVEMNAAMKLEDFLQGLEAGLNITVFIGIIVIFLVSIENRIKRGRALQALHELRSIAHIIDMHQLTKDPDPFLIAQYQKTASSPERKLDAFALSRYFDYCSEMLSLTGKIAALYIEKYNDPAVISAVNDIENLTSGLASKIWQKSMILHSAISTVRLTKLLKQESSRQQ